MSPRASSVLPSTSDGPSSNGSLHELAAPKVHSQCVTTPLVGSYPAFSPLPPPSSGGGYFLLHCSTLADCFYIRKWAALCCPDFPLPLRVVPTHGQRRTVRLLSACKGTENKWNTKKIGRKNKKLLATLQHCNIATNPIEIIPEMVKKSRLYHYDRHPMLLITNHFFPFFWMRSTPTE